jgi:hypothetical protein
MEKLNNKMHNDFTEQELMILAQAKMRKDLLASKTIGGYNDYSLSKLKKLGLITVQFCLFNDDKVIRLTKKGMEWKKSHGGLLRKVQNKLKRKTA